uniref:Putative terminase n=1 Tax=viral metagenome TaxID=1070528 RepID=A0A6M3L0U0_9ZZZZ
MQDVAFKNEAENVIENYKSNPYFLAKDLLGFADLTPSFHYKYICKKLMEPRKQLIRLWLLPRGFFKTTILTITDCIRLQLNTPNIRILIVSGVLANAVSMVNLIGYQYISNKRFRTLFPKWCPIKPHAPETTWKGTEIHVPNREGRPVMEGTFEAFGPESTLTSRHYDYIKMDDLVTRENSTTKEQMDKIKDFYRALFPLRDNPQTPIDVIGTRWDDYDVYGDMEGDPEVEVIKVPATINGKPTFPERYPLHELQKIKQDNKMGTYLYSCLYDLDPVSQENAIFKEKWFKYYTISTDRRFMKRQDDKVVPIGHIFMSVDGAITEGKNDYAAIVITTTDADKDIYVLETWFDQVDPITLLKKMKETYFKWSVLKCALQTTVLEKMLKFYLKEMMRKEKFYMNLIPLKKNTALNKEYLIKSIQPWYEHGCIWHLASMKGGELEEELVRFPKAKHDDVADALQMHQEIVIVSPKKVVPRDYDRNSLHAWKKRLKKIMSQQEYFHLGNNPVTEINEFTY